METGVGLIQEPVLTKTSIEEAPAGLLLDHSSMEVDKLNHSSVLDDEIASRDDKNNITAGEVDVAEVINGSGNKEAEKVEAVKTVSVVGDSKVDKEKASETEKDELETKHTPEQVEESLNSAREEIPMNTHEVKVEKDSLTVETAPEDETATNSTSVHDVETTASGSKSLKENLKPVGPEQISNELTVDKEKEEVQEITPVIDTPTVKGEDTEEYVMVRDIPQRETLATKTDETDAEPSLNLKEDKKPSDPVQETITTIQKEEMESIISPQLKEETDQSSKDTEEDEHVLERNMPEGEIIGTLPENLETKEDTKPLHQNEQEKETKLHKEEIEKQEPTNEGVTNAQEALVEETPDQVVQVSSVSASEKQEHVPVAESEKITQHQKGEEKGSYGLETKEKSLTEPESSELGVKSEEEELNFQKEQIEKHEPTDEEVLTDQQTPVEKIKEDDIEESLSSTDEVNRDSRPDETSINGTKAQDETLVITEAETVDTSLSSPLEVKQTLGEASELVVESEEEKPKQVKEIEETKEVNDTKVDTFPQESTLSDVVPVQIKREDNATKRHESQEEFSKAEESEETTVAQEEQNIRDIGDSLAETQLEEQVEGETKTKEEQGFILSGETLQKEKEDDITRKQEEVINEKPVIEKDQTETIYTPEQEEQIEANKILSEVTAYKDQEEVQGSLTVIDTPIIQEEEIDSKASKDTEEHEHVLVRDIPQNEAVEALKVQDSEILKNLETKTVETDAEPSLNLKEDNKPSDPVQETITIIEPPTIQKEEMESIVSPEFKEETYQSSKDTNEDEHVLERNMPEGEIIGTLPDNLKTKQDTKPLHQNEQERETKLHKEEIEKQEPTNEGVTNAQEALVEEKPDQVVASEKQEHVPVAESEKIEDEKVKEAGDTEEHEHVSVREIPQAESLATESETSTVQESAFLKTLETKEDTETIKDLKEDKELEETDVVKTPITSDEVQETPKVLETPTIQGEDTESKASKDIEEHEHVLARDLPQDETLVTEAETVDTSLSTPLEVHQTLGEASELVAESQEEKPKQVKEIEEIKEVDDTKVDTLPQESTLSDIVPVQIKREDNATESQEEFSKAEESKETTVAQEEQQTRDIGDSLAETQLEGETKTKEEQGFILSDGTLQKEKQEEESVQKPVTEDEQTETKHTPEQVEEIYTGPVKGDEENVQKSLNTVQEITPVIDTPTIQGEDTEEHDIPQRETLATKYETVENSTAQESEILKNLETETDETDAETSLNLKEDKKPSDPTSIEEPAGVLLDKSSMEVDKINHSTVLDDEITSPDTEQGSIFVHEPESSNPKIVLSDAYLDKKKEEVMDEKPVIEEDQTETKHTPEQEQQIKANKILSEVTVDKEQEEVQGSLTIIDTPKIQEEEVDSKASKDTEELEHVLVRDIPQNEAVEALKVQESEILKNLETKTVETDAELSLKTVSVVEDSKVDKETEKDEQGFILSDETLQKEKEDDITRKQEEVQEITPVIDTPTMQREDSEEHLMVREIQQRGTLATKYETVETSTVQESEILKNLETKSDETDAEPSLNLKEDNKPSDLVQETITTIQKEEMESIISPQLKEETDQSSKGTKEDEHVLERNMPEGEIIGTLPENLNTEEDTKPSLPGVESAEQIQRPSLESHDEVSEEASKTVDEKIEEKQEEEVPLHQNEQELHKEDIEKQETTNEGVTNEQETLVEEKSDDVVQVSSVSASEEREGETVVGVKHETVAEAEKIEDEKVKEAEPSGDTEEQEHVSVRDISQVETLPTESEAVETKDYTEPIMELKEDKEQEENTVITSDEVRSSNNEPETSKTVDEKIEEQPEEVTLQQKGIEEGSYALETKEKSLSKPESSELGVKSQEEESSLPNEKEKETIFQEEDIKQKADEVQETPKVQETPTIQGEDTESKDTEEHEHVLSRDLPQDETIVTEGETVDTSPVQEAAILKTLETETDETEAVHNPIDGEVKGQDTKEDTEPSLDVKADKEQDETKTDFSFDIKDESQGREESVDVKPTEIVQDESQEELSKAEAWKETTVAQEEQQTRDIGDSLAETQLEEQVEGETKTKEPEDEFLDSSESFDKEPLTAETKKEDEAIKEEEIHNLEAPTKLEEPEEDKSPSFVSDLEDQIPKQIEEIHEEETKVEAATSDQTSSLVSPKKVEEIQQEETKEATPRESSDEALVSTLASKEDDKVTPQEGTSTTLENVFIKQEEIGDLEAPKLEESKDISETTEPIEAKDDQTLAIETSEASQPTSFISELEDKIPKQVEEIHEEATKEALKEEATSDQNLLVEASHENETSKQFEEIHEEQETKASDQTPSSELVSELEDQTPKKIEETHEEVTKAEESQDEEILPTEIVPREQHVSAGEVIEEQDSLKNETPDDFTFSKETREEDHGDDSSSTLPVVGILTQLQTTFENERAINESASSEEKTITEPAEQVQKTSDAESSKNDLHSIKEEPETGLAGKSLPVEELKQEEQKEEVKVPEEEIVEPVHVTSVEKQEEHNGVQDLNASTTETVTLQDEHPREFEFPKTVEDVTDQVIESERKEETHETVKEEDEIVDHKEEKKTEDKEDASKLDVAKEEAPHSDLGNVEEINKVATSEKKILELPSEAEKESTEQHVETQTISEDTPKDQTEEVSVDKSLTKEVLGNEIQSPNPLLEETSFEVKKAQEDITEESAKDFITNEDVQVQDQPKNFEAPVIDKETTEHEQKSIDLTDVYEDNGTNVKQVDVHDSVATQKEETEPEAEIKHEVSVEEKNNAPKKIDLEATKEIYQEESKQTDTNKEEIKEEQKETTPVTREIENLSSVSNTQDKSKQKDEVPTPKLENIKTAEVKEESEETVQEPARKSLSSLIEKVEGTNKNDDITTKEEAKIEEEDENDDKTSPDSIVMVEAKDTIIKTQHKKSPGILSQVKHSISKVKKVFTGHKSSHTTS